MLARIETPQWEYYVPWFFSRVPPAYRRKPVVMRRRSPNGSWNYRQPTEAERQEWWEACQW